MSENRKTIVAVGAHTGDAQLTCGLLLARYAMQGDRVVTIDLTAGERGAPAGTTTAEFRKVNEEGAAKFARMLSGESVVLDTPDGELEYTKDAAARLGDILRKYNASVVLGHWKHSMHRDHIAASRLTRDAVFFASLPTFERPLPPAPVRRFLYAENWEDAEDFRPYAYFDVSEAFHLWKEAVKNLYLTEHSRDFKYLQYYEGLARMRGALIRKEYGTAFGVETHGVKTILETA